MDARDLLEQPDFVPPEIKDIEITEAAVNRLLQVGYKQVEFSVEGGGCSRMNYKMTKFDRKINDNDKTTDAFGTKRYNTQTGVIENETYSSMHNIQGNKIY